MGTSLNGLNPASTYQALIKVGNNTNLNTTLKTLSDGAGNDLPMQASTTAINFTGTVSGVASGVSGAIQFSNGSAFASDASNLFWDDTNNYLGIGTTSPVAKLQVNGVTALSNADLTGYPLYSAFNIVRNGATSMAIDRYTGAPHFNFRAAGGTIASPSTQVGELGKIDFWSYSGTSFNQNVRLIAQAENFVGGLAQTQRLSIGMGETGSGIDYYYEMVNGNSYFGAAASGTTPTARVQIKGSGSTSATKSFLVQNSAGTDLFKVQDDGVTTISSVLSVTSYISTGDYITTNGIVIGNGNSRLYAFNGANANLSINNTGIVASTSGYSSSTASAVLEATSTTQGFLPPRMTTTQKNAIASPAEGLEMYDSTAKSPAYYDGTNWGYTGGALQNAAGNSGTLNISFAAGNIVNLTLNANTTLAFSNAVIGTYIIQVTQGATGANVLTYPASVKWAGGTAPTLTTTVGKTDILTFYYDGTFYYGNYSLNY